jgi:pimeloyl-ACP methyl ester carboxylesterase
MKTFKCSLMFFFSMISVSAVFSQIQPVKIELYSKGSLLNAFFYQGSTTKPGPVVILLHGWPGNADNPMGLAPKICAGGINVLVFNFRGTWGSQGYNSIKNSAEDISEAIHFLNQKNISEKYGIDTSQIIVAGYSLGGGAAMTAALYDPEVKKVISIAGADISVFIRMLAADQQFRSNFEERTRSQSGEGGLARIEGDIPAFVDDMIKNLDYFDLVKNAELLKSKEILFIVGWDDTTGKMEENALPLYRKLKQLKAPDVSIAAFTDNHAFTNSRDDLAKTIVEWIKKRN